MSNRLPVPRPLATLSLCLAGATSLVLIPAGCDEKPKPPPAVVEAARRPPAPEAPAEPPHPTTQQLVDGPRHTVSLEAIPFSLNVPLSWSIKTDAGRTVLAGPAPESEVTVLLTAQPQTTAERIGLLESGAKKEAAADPRRYRSATLTKIGGIQVFERQQLGTTLPGADSPTLRWTVTAFAPRPNNAFTPFELNFIGLTAKAYDAHAAFFRGIVASLAYEQDRDTGT